jgi:hypothetical protein
LVVSRYHWEKKGNGCSISDFRRWLPKYADKSSSELEYNEHSNIVQRVWEVGGGFIHDLQTPFVFEKMAIGVQFVGRYENLSEDFKLICNLLEIIPPTLPRLKVGFRERLLYQDFYDSHSKMLVGHAFVDDIENFCYLF